MQAPALVERPQPAQRRRTGREPDPHLQEDVRFRSLVGEAAWERLPEAVRRRFSRHLGPAEVIVYRGEVLSTEMSRAGRLVANLARLIGSPLPLDDAMKGAAVVVVADEPTLGGQVWTRVYARPGRVPQAFHSVKRFTGPTGLEEAVGGGLSMTLDVSVVDGALVFRSAGYRLRIGPWRVTLPKLLTPGTMTIVHKDRGGGRFLFTLTVAHPLIGQLIAQSAHFSEA